jgi:hypothetical protein
MMRWTFEYLLLDDALCSLVERTLEGCSRPFLLKSKVESLKALSIPLEGELLYIVHQVVLLFFVSQHQQ